MHRLAIVHLLEDAPRGHQRGLAVSALVYRLMVRLADGVSFARAVLAGWRAAPTRLRSAAVAQRVER